MTTLNGCPHGTDETEGWCAQCIAEGLRGLPEGQFAIVELFGHSTLVGRIEEVDRFGTKMLSIEALFNGDFLPAVLHGGASIYRLTPCDALTAIKHQPRQTYQLPASIRAIVPPALLPAPAPAAVDDEPVF